MKYSLVFVLPACVLFGAPVMAVSDIYRCESESGVRYADEPCSDRAEKITVPDNHIGGSFNQNLPEPLPEPETTPEPESQQTTNEADTCRFINSTKLRRHLLNGEVVKGMTQEHVEEAFGRPRETYPVPQETWVYETKYYGALYALTYVYFNNGCVEEVVYRKP